jgi:hypothetical protein
MNIWQLFLLYEYSLLYHVYSFDFYKPVVSTSASCWRGPDIKSDPEISPEISTAFPSSSRHILGQ